VSSDLRTQGASTGFADPPAIGGEAEPPGFDRVMRTAGDPTAGDTPQALVDPAADHFDPELSRRRDEVDESHRRVVGFLQALGRDALVLTRADSIAWFSAGADVTLDLTSEGGSVALFVNGSTRSILADNVQSARVFEEELAGLGFHLKERPWHQDPGRIIAELTHHKKALADAPIPGLEYEPEKLRAIRRPMTPGERARLRSLGRTLTLAVEATCRNFRPGETEADVAGHLAHRLMREGVVPVELRVVGDDRGARYRRPTFKSAEIRRKATITATGRRQGLCAAVSRTVCFGKLDEATRHAHAIASMVDATCIYFSRPGEPISEIFRRARRIYEKFDHPHEWTLDYQGDLIGYAPREGPLRPDDPSPLQDGSALRWSPSVGSARSEDTVVVDARGFEVVTEAQDWPKVEVAVKDYPIFRPGILER